ncbi:uncharacterized protein [Malus domestica]|uniref:uncharacterized protein n=1 Tax=Malus domestica TaxID=3750 RepID=UPI003974C19A
MVVYKKVITKKCLQGCYEDYECLSVCDIHANVHFVWAGLVTYGDGGRVWNVRERKGEGGLHLRAQLESLVSAAVATTLPQSAAHFPPKSHLKLFQFRTRDVRRRLNVLFMWLRLVHSSPAATRGHFC